MKAQILVAGQQKEINIFIVVIPSNDWMNHMRQRGVIYCWNLLTAPQWPLYGRWLPLIFPGSNLRSHGAKDSRTNVWYSMRMVAWMLGGGSCLGSFLVLHCFQMAFFFFFWLQDTTACIIIVNKIERGGEASTRLKAVFSFQGAMKCEIHCFPRPQRPAL